MHGELCICMCHTHVSYIIHIFCVSFVLSWKKANKRSWFLFCYLQSQYTQRIALYCTYAYLYTFLFMQHVIWWCIVVREKSSLQLFDKCVVVYAFFICICLLCSRVKQSYDSYNVTNHIWNVDHFYPMITQF